MYYSSKRENHASSLLAVPFLSLRQRSVCYALGFSPCTFMVLGHVLRA